MPNAALQILPSLTTATESAGRWLDSRASRAISEISSICLAESPSVEAAAAEPSNAMDMPMSCAIPFCTTASYSK